MSNSEQLFEAPDSGERHPPEVERIIDLVRHLAKRTGKSGQRQQAEALNVSTTRLNAYLNGTVPPEETLIKMLRKAGLPDSEHAVHLRARQRAKAIKRPVAASRASASMAAGLIDLNRVDARLAGSRS
jgi:hypothetical protein